MELYLLQDNPPSKFGEFELLGIYIKLENAERKLIELQNQDEYVNQYVEIKMVQTKD